MSAVPALDELRADAERAGLAWRGAFHPLAADAVPPLEGGARAGTLVLLGFVGGGEWPAFAASAEYLDGGPDPLDRWSRRVIGALGARHGAAALFPFDGPPWLPFQRWAVRAEAVHVSPLGVLIHPDWGLWHAYRGALALRARIALPPRDRRGSPCTTCVGRPCERSCPVAAVTPAGYDAAACARHVAAPAGRDCLAEGCRARRACPVGAAHRYPAAQAGFHMRAFLRAR